MQGKQLEIAQKAEERTWKAEERGQKMMTTAGTRGNNERSSMRVTKHPQTDTHCSSDVNESECCVCYVTYDDGTSGKDWVACTCGRWQTVQMIVLWMMRDMSEVICLTVFSGV